MSVPPKSVAVPALDLKAQYQSIRDEIEPVDPAGDREPDVRPWAPKSSSSRPSWPSTAARPAGSAARRGPMRCCCP